VIPVLVVLAHLLGLGSALRAIFTARSSQGAVAWSLALVLMPYLTVPIYWILGSSRFQGYLDARRGGASELADDLSPALESIRDWQDESDDERGEIRAVERLARLPILRGNTTELLVDGEAAFTSLFEGIGGAQESIVVQYYIIRDDETGRRLQSLLMDRAQVGVRVHLLYDAIGSYALPSRYTRELKEAGVEVHPFRSTRFGSPTRFQVNFRNHRKIVVVDGRVGWVGGLNVGDEYRGMDPDYGDWRDTHLRVEGPAALALQLTFVEDWHWATSTVPELPWTPRPAGEESVLILPSGPADERTTAGLFMQLAFHSATDRIWVASPYFVPDDGVLEALKVAAFRGVDVRILIPDHSDSRTVDLARMPSLERLLTAGVRVHCYNDGFLHAKTILIDEAVGGVGTVNLDYRSFQLNFEITALLFAPQPIQALADSFEEDLNRSPELTLDQLNERPFVHRLGSRVAHLFAPVL
jgi:cardiolipin synthase A/B